MCELWNCCVEGVRIIASRYLDVFTSSHFSAFFVHRGAAIGIRGGKAQRGMRLRVVERMGLRVGKRDGMKWLALRRRKTRGRRRNV